MQKEETKKKKRAGKSNLLFLLFAKKKKKKMSKVAAELLNNIFSSSVVQITFGGSPALSTGIVNLKALLGSTEYVLVKTISNEHLENNFDNDNNNVTNSTSNNKNNDNTYIYSSSSFVSSTFLKGVKLQICEHAGLPFGCFIVEAGGNYEVVRNSDIDWKNIEFSNNVDILKNNNNTVMLTNTENFKKNINEVEQYKENEKNYGKKKKMELEIRVKHKKHLKENNNYKEEITNKKKGKKVNNKKFLINEVEKKRKNTTQNKKENFYYQNGHKVMRVMNNSDKEFSDNDKKETNKSSVSNNNEMCYSDQTKIDDNLFFNDFCDKSIEQCVQRVHLETPTPPQTSSSTEYENEQCENNSYEEKIKIKRIKKRKLERSYNSSERETISPALVNMSLTNKTQGRRLPMNNYSGSSSREGGNSPVLYNLGKNNKLEGEFYLENNTENQNFINNNNNEIKIDTNGEQLTNTNLFVVSDKDIVNEENGFIDSMVTEEDETVNQHGLSEHSVLNGDGNTFSNFVNNGWDPVESPALGFTSVDNTLSQDFSLDSSSITSSVDYAY